MSQTRPTKAEIDTYAGHYVLYGEQSNAWRATFPNSKSNAHTTHTKASKFHALAEVQARIGELKAHVRKVAEEEFKIDAAWVLKSAKRIFDRCMQDEPVYDRSGERVFVETPEGEAAAAYTFEHAGANKALDTIGKHIDVQAFNENLSIKTGSEVTPWGEVKASVDKLKD